MQEDDDLGGLRHWTTVLDLWEVVDLGVIGWLLVVVGAVARWIGHRERRKRELGVGDHPGVAA